jgi:hypothetical protein
MVILEAGMLAPAKSWAGYPQRGREMRNTVAAVQDTVPAS